MNNLRIDRQGITLSGFRIYVVLIAATLMLVSGNAGAVNFCKGRHYSPDLCDEGNGTAGDSGG